VTSVELVLVFSIGAANVMALEVVRGLVFYCHNLDLAYPRPRTARRTVLTKYILKEEGIGRSIDWYVVEILLCSGKTVEIRFNSFQAWRWTRFILIFIKSRLYYNLLIVKIVLGR
jgi:hypothetical protein